MRFFRLKTFIGIAALILSIFLIYVSEAHSAQISKMQVRDLFPKVESLDGGAELWLNTGIRSKKEGNHTVFSTTYSYYSGKDKKMMNIIRKGQYETNIALYSFNNFVDASMYFRELTKDAPENRSQQVKFGERGLFFIYPKSGYINDADFFLVFINKTFVVWIHANDGFALMDIANPVNDALEKYIVDNTEMYLIKKLTIEAYAKGYEIETKQLEFTTDYPASIKVSGKIFSKEIDPLPVATVNILETGDSLYTDSEGYFEHTILLDGIDDIELGTNFYLKPDKADELTRFRGGLLESTLKHNRSGKERNQMWSLETAGNKIFGKSYVKTKSGYKPYPIKGETAADGTITLTLDCRQAGSDFGREQTFKGKREAGGITGTWSGTGGGGLFSADSGGYSPVKRKTPLTDKTAQIKTFAVDFSGMLQKSAENLLNIGAGMDSNAMIYVSPERDALNLNPMKTISAKLVLTHLPKDQSGTISIFKYSIKHKGTRAFLDKSSYAGQLFKNEEPYTLEIDITDLLTESDGAFVIGGVPEAGSYGNHLFSSAGSQYESLKPYILVTEYSKNGETKKSEKPFVFFDKPEKSEDLIGDRNRPGKDGNADICFNTVFSYPGKKLTGFELEITGDIRRKYNTNPLDIYPLVGLISDGRLLNDSKGNVEHMFEKASEKIGVCINGTFEKNEDDRISYKYYIDGKPHEGFVSKD